MINCICWRRFLASGTWKRLTGPNRVNASISACFFAENRGLGGGGSVLWRIRLCTYGLQSFFFLRHSTTYAWAHFMGWCNYVLGAFARERQASRHVCPTDLREISYWRLLLQLVFIHLVVRLTTDPKPHPKWTLRIVWSGASSFKWEHPLLSLRSSSSFLFLLPRLPVKFNFN